MKNVTDSAPSSEGLVFNAPLSEPFELKFESGIDDALSLARSDPQTCAQACLDALQIAITDSGQHEPGPDWVELAVKFIQIPGQPENGPAESATAETLRDACIGLVDSKTATQLRGLFLRIASHGLHVSSSTGRKGDAHRLAYKRARRSSARIGRAALTGFLAVVASRAKGNRKRDCIAALHGIATLDNEDFELKLDREDETVRAGLVHLPGWPSWALWLVARLDRLEVPLQSVSDLIWDRDFQRQRAGFSEWLARNERLMAGAAVREPPDSPSAPIESRANEQAAPATSDAPTPPTWPKPNNLSITILNILMEAGEEFTPQSMLPGKSQRETIRKLRELGWPIESADEARGAGKSIPKSANGYRLNPDTPLGRDWDAVGTRGT